MDIFLLSCDTESGMELQTDSSVKVNIQFLDSSLKLQDCKLVTCLDPYFHKETTIIYRKYKLYVE